MRFILSLFRIVKFAVQNFFRNFWLSFITITIFVLTLLTVNVIIFMNVFADAALKSVENRVEVSISFYPETSEEIAKAAQGYLLGYPQVRDARFIHRTEVLETFKTRYANDQAILDSLTVVGGNPFGHEVIVSAHSSQDFPFILEVIETPEFSPFIKEKDFDDFQNVIENIKLVSTRIRYAGIALALFFGLVAMMIVFNTIRVAIYVHREEIGIMKLVGANDWFVKGPFLLEAIMYTVVAMSVVLLGGVTTLKAIEPWAAGFFGNISVDMTAYFIENGWWIFGIQFLGLTLLALMTTSTAMRKYLRV